MLFDAKARTKLDAIIHGAAVGETVGLLASRMSDAERAEKLTAEGILQLTDKSDLTSTSAEMLRATISGLEAADALGSPSNLDIRVHIHKAYRAWVGTSPKASLFRNIHLTQAIQTEGLGSFTSVARGGNDGMLRVAPIGLAFADDPGRAFQVGAEAAALLDADFNGYLCAGVVSLVFALVESGLNMLESIAEAADFIRPWDWAGEISNVLRSLADDEVVGCYSHQAVSALHAALQLAATAPTPGTLSALTSKPNWRAAALAGQLAIAVTAPGERDRASPTGVPTRR